MAFGLDICNIWDVVSTRLAQNDESSLTLTYFMVRSNLISNAYIREMFNLMRQWFYISTKCQATCDLLSNASHLDSDIPI